MHLKGSLYRNRCFAVASPSLRAALIVHPRSISHSVQPVATFNINQIERSKLPKMGLSLRPLEIDRNRPDVPFSFPLQPTHQPLPPVTATSSRAPNLPSQPSGLLLTPVKRFPNSSVGIFHSRGLDYGEPGMALVRCEKCRRPLMEGKAVEHTGELIIIPTREACTERL